MIVLKFQKDRSTTTKVIIQKTLHLQKNDNDKYIKKTYQYPRIIQFRKHESFGTLT